MNKIVFYLKVVVGILFLTSPMSYATSATTISIAESYVSQVFDIEQIEAKVLKKELDKDKIKYLLFDVREKEEYDMSHIKDSIRINPKTQIKNFFKKYGKKLHDKTVVFYCSVGVRSSTFIEKITKYLKLQKRDSEFRFLSLKGGIFRWKFSGYPLWDKNGKTSQVYGYKE